VWFSEWVHSPSSTIGGLAPTGPAEMAPSVAATNNKWEYPWYAAWDLAFHTLSLCLVDVDFAKEQLLLMLRSLYFSSEWADSGL